MTARPARASVALLAVLSLLAPAAADDEPKGQELKAFLVLTDGTQQTVDKVKEATSSEVTVQIGGSLQKTPAEKVARVVPTGDQALDYALRLIASKGDAGRIESQLKRALDRGEPWVKPYAQFFLGELYEQRMNDAAKALAAYEAVATLDKNHFYAPLGIYRAAQLLSRGGKAAEAAQRVQRLAGGEFGPSWAARAGYEQGRALLAAGKHAEAKGFFSKLRSAGAEDLRQLAAASEAACDLAAGKKEDAKRAFQLVAGNAKAPPAALGIAWKGLGDCEKGGNADEAMLAYLRSFLLYPSNPDANAAAGGAAEVAGTAKLDGAQRLGSLSRSRLSHEDFTGTMPNAELMRRTTQLVSAGLTKRFAPILAGKAQGDEKAELEFIACDAIRTIATQSNNPDMLKEYEEKLKELQAKYPKHARAGAAGLDSFQVTKDRAMAIIGKANEESDPSKKDQLLAEGRKLFQDALEPFKRSIAELTKKVDALTEKEAGGPDALSEQEKDDKAETEYKRDFSEFLLAEAYAGFAQTFPEGSDERKKHVQEALKGYEFYINDRGTYPNLLNYSYLGSIEANIELGNTEDAIGSAIALTDVTLPFEPADPQMKKQLTDMCKDVCIRAFYNLLRACNKAGKYAEGLAEANKIDERPMAKGWQDHNMGVLFQFEKAKSMGGAGQGAKAAEELYAIVAKSKQAAEADKIPALGMTRIGAGACRALSELSDASGGEVYAPEVQFHVGIGYFLRQRTELAIAAFKGVLVSARTQQERAEWVPKAVKEIGQLLFTQDRFLEAALAYETIVREFPTHEMAGEAVRFSLAAAKKACEQFGEDPTGSSTPLAKYYKQVSSAASSADEEIGVKTAMTEAADKQTKEDYVGAAEAYLRVPAEIDTKGGKKKVSVYPNAVANAGYCFFQAYKKGKNNDHLNKGRENLAKAAQLAKDANDREAQSLACFYLGELENDLGRHKEALDALAPFDQELSSTTRYIVRARNQQALAHFSLGQADALEKAEAAFKTVEDKTSDQQLGPFAYFMASKIRALCQKTMKEKPAELSAIRGLRAKAGLYAKAFFDGMPKEKLREQVYHWVGDVVFSGGHWGDAARIYKELLTKFKRPEIDGKKESQEAQSDFDTAELNLGYALVLSGQQKEGYEQLKKVQGMVQLKNRDGNLLAVGTFKKRALEGPFTIKFQGRTQQQQVWFTYVEVGGQEKKFFDVEPPGGGDSEFRCVEGGDPTKQWQPSDKRLIQAPLKRDFLVVDGMARAAWSQYEASKDKAFLANELTAACNELRYVLRGLSDASYRSLVSNIVLDQTDYNVKRWQADLQYLRIKMAREAWREVASDINQMKLLGNAPPTPELQQELEAIRVEAEGKAGK